MNIHLLAQRSLKTARVSTIEALFYILLLNLVALVALLLGAKPLIISSAVQ
jgi:hypothetical protein